MDLEHKIEVTETLKGYRIAYAGASVNAVVLAGEFTLEGLESDGTEPWAVVALLKGVVEVAKGHGYSQLHVYFEPSIRDEHMTESQKRLYEAYIKYGFRPSYQIISVEI